MFSFLLPAILFLLNTGGEGENVFPGNIVLHSSLEPTRQLAEAQNKLFIVAFSAKWCMPCRLMEESTFKNADLIRFLEANYIFKKIDIDDFEGFNVKQYYDVSLLPTFIIFDTRGNVLGRYEESLSAARMLPILKRHRYSRPSWVGSRDDGPAKNIPVTSRTAAISNPARPSVLIGQVELFDKSDKKPVRKLKKNGKNWNFTRVAFQLKARDFALLEGKELVLRISDPHRNRVLSALAIPVLSRNNSIQISHPGYKELGSKYVIEILYRTSDGSLSLLEKGSKPIITDYDPLE